MTVPPEVTENKISKSPEGSKAFKEGLPLDRFVAIAKGDRHCIGIDSHGKAFSWGKSNKLGQLGRDTSSVRSQVPGLIPMDVSIQSAFVSFGGGSGTTIGSGHSALLDTNGMLWMAGCDRWQQLGLGSSKGGSSGYTWKDGKLWQDRFVPSVHVLDLMKEDHTRKDPSSPPVSIRDIALGGDHTLVLSSNQRDVYCFGKGGDGQLGLVGKPYVSAPVKSRLLSEEGVSAVCAVAKCSMTLDATGNVKRKIGKCRANSVQEGLEACVIRARERRLITSEEFHSKQQG